MIHLTYISLVIATVANALLMSLCRLNEPVYHMFEVVTIVAYAAFGYMFAKSDQKLNWLIVWVMVRFSMYSQIWGYVAYKNPLYLGDGAWSDKFLKWLFYDLMNQGPGALGWTYFVVGVCSVLMYLKIYYDQKA